MNGWLEESFSPSSFLFFHPVGKSRIANYPGDKPENYQIPMKTRKLSRNLADVFSL